MRRSLLLLLASASLAGGQLPGLATTHPAAPGLHFKPAVRMPTPPGFGGLEPSTVVDRSGNVWVTAHKTYYGVASPATGSPSRVQAASWLWTSPDGKNFASPPGGTALAEQNLQYGDEADLAVDSAGDVFSSDLTVVGSSFSAWKVAGRGRITFLHSSPESPTQVSLSADRPFISAGGVPGRVLLTANDTDVATLARTAGRYPVYVSNDTGRTWTPPIYLPGQTSFCRPLVDVRRASQYLYVACAASFDDSLTMHTSRDGGRTWHQSLMTKTAHFAFSQGNAGIANWPSLGQSPDGTLYALATHYAITPGDPSTNGVQPEFGNTTLTLLISRDSGRSWVPRDVTPERGVWQHASLAVAPDGRLGIAGYYRARHGDPLRMRAAVFHLGERPHSVLVDPARAATGPNTPSPGGDFTQSVFGPDGKYRVVWVVDELQAADPAPALALGKPYSGAIYYAEQR